MSAGATLLKITGVTVGILFFVVRSFAGESNTPALFKLADVLPSGWCEIELMTIRFSDRANELALKMQAAVSTNRDWFLEQIKRAKPGEPLDYDPRLGLTKKEYSEYLREVENRHLASTGTRLPSEFRRTGDMLSLDVGDTNCPLSKIQLDTISGELFASVGRVGMPTWDSNNDPGRPIGRYDGCEWLYEKGDSNTFTVRIVKLNIWRLKPSGIILWRFQDSDMVNKQSKQNFDIAFEYSLQTTNKTARAK